MLPSGLVPNPAASVSCRSPSQVGTHGEDLVAPPVGAEQIASGVEHYRVCHRVLEHDPIVPVADSAVGAGASRTIAARWANSPVQVGDLAQPPTLGVSGEDLAEFAGVHPQRVGGGQKERAPPGAGQEPEECVEAAEVRQLAEIPRSNRRADEECRVWWNISPRVTRSQWQTMRP
jgi:hypothetical protein